MKYLDWQLMSKEKLVPELRFPEFLNEGEWEESVLGSVVEIKGRIGYRGYTTEDIVDKGKGAITLSPSNFNENGRLNFDKCTYISWDKYEESPEIQLEEGQTVLVKTASVGKTAYVDEIPEKTTVNPQIVVLKPKTIHNRFLAYTVSHYNTQNQIRNNVGAGAIPNISQEIISKLKILLPPDKAKKEQQKIASCLSSLDEVILNYHRKVELLKSQKAGLMQNLFAEEGEKMPKIRFKEFEKDGEWVERKLEELAKRGSGHTPNKQMSNYYNGGVKWVSLADSSKLDDRYIYDTKIHVSKEGIKNSSAVLHSAGTVILSRDAGVGKCAVMHSEMAVSQHFIVWLCDESKLSKWFLYYVFQILKPVFESIAIGSTIKTIGLPYFKELLILIPSINEQQKIASCLYSLDDLITTTSEKIEQLKLHKKGLMQGLFPKVNH